MKLISVCKTCIGCQHQLLYVTHGLYIPNIFAYKTMSMCYFVPRNDCQYYRTVIIIVFLSQKQVLHSYNRNLLMVDIHGIKYTTLFRLKTVAVKHTCPDYWNISCHVNMNTVCFLSLQTNGGFLEKESNAITPNYC